MKKNGTNIVILGSCQHSPYRILAKPVPVPKLHNTEAGYKKAAKKFYPAIGEADLILVYNPYGSVGEHTQKDIDYANLIGKKVIFISPSKGAECALCGNTLVNDEDHFCYGCHSYICEACDETHACGVHSINDHKRTLSFLIRKLFKRVEVVY